MIYDIYLSQLKQTKKNIIMRAIITNLKKESVYSKYNGLTFEVQDCMRGLVGLKIPSESSENLFYTADFSWNEIMIVDLKIEIKSFKNTIDYLSGIKNIDYGKEINDYQNKINYLEKYCKYKKIKL